MRSRTCMVPAVLFCGVLTPPCPPWPKLHGFARRPLSNQSLPSHRAHALASQCCAGLNEHQRLVNERRFSGRLAVPGTPPSYEDRPGRGDCEQSNIVPKPESRKPKVIPEGKEETSGDAQEPVAAKVGPCRFALPASDERVSPRGLNVILASHREGQTHRQARTSQDAVAAGTNLVP